MLWWNFTCISFWNLCECVNVSSVSKRIQTACFESVVNSVAHPEALRLSLKGVSRGVTPSALTECFFVWGQEETTPLTFKPDPLCMTSQESWLQDRQKRERHCRRADGNECCGVSEAHMRKRGGGGKKWEEVAPGRVSLGLLKALECEEDSFSHYRFDNRTLRTSSICWVFVFHLKEL